MHERLYSVRPVTTGTTVVLTALVVPPAVGVAQTLNDPTVAVRDMVQPTVLDALLGHVVPVTGVVMLNAGSRSKPAAIECSAVTLLNV